MNKFSIIIVMTIIVGCTNSNHDDMHIYISDHLEDCIGVGPQKCMLVKFKPNDEYLLFYDKIEGFTYVEGYTYQLKVKKEKLKNVPADASTLRYSLIEIISKEKTVP